MLGRSFVLGLAALLALGLAFGVLACGSPSTPESSSTTSSGGTGSTSPAGSIPHPTGAADVVLRVSADGGMESPYIGENYIHQPEFTLYGDGRIILGSPGVLPNLRTTMVSEKVIQNVLAAAREAKLFQNGVDYGQPGVDRPGHHHHHDQRGWHHLQRPPSTPSVLSQRGRLWSVGAAEGPGCHRRLPRQTERPGQFRSAAAHLGGVRLHGSRSVQRGGAP